MALGLLLLSALLIFLRNMALGAIFILRKDIGVGRWSKKWQFSLTLCTDNVLTWVGRWFKKASKHPYVIERWPLM